MDTPFWDHVWAEREPYLLDPQTYYERAESSERQFLDAIGDLAGKEVLEIGCGTGDLAVWAARSGARVVAIDTSPVAVEATRSLAEYNGEGTSVKARELDAMDAAALEARFDLVFGRFVLHHVEPFDEFTSVLFDVLRDGGRGVFYENNARNPMLMFCRTFLVGRFGLPKYGDDDEYPLEPREVEELRKQFTDVRIAYPNFVFFHLISTYLFRHNERLRWGSRILRSLDRWIYVHVPALHKYGYHQIVEMKKGVG